MKPQAGLYFFPGWIPERFNIRDDEQFVLDFSVKKKSSWYRGPVSTGRIPTISGSFSSRPWRIDRRPRQTCPVSPGLPAEMGSGGLGLLFFQEVA